MKRIFALLIIVFGSLYCNAQDYEPLVREGVKWKCGMLHDSYIAPEKSYIEPYAIFFKGDTIIGDYMYKNCLVIPEGDPEEISDSTVCGFAREDIAAKKVYFRCNENYCTELPFYELPCAYLDYSDKNTQRTDEVLLYDFNDITQSIELRAENLQVYEYDSVIIDYEENSGRLYKRHNMGSELTVIEGVGCGGTVSIYRNDNFKTGDLINMLPLLTAGMTQEYHIFYHLEDAEGNIIYDAPNDPPGIGGIGEVAKASEEAEEVARYDVHGRRLAKPVPGINIIRMSDGTVRKTIGR